MKESREQRRQKEELHTIQQTKIHNNLNGLEKYSLNMYSVHVLLHILDTCVYTCTCTCVRLYMYKCIYTANVHVHMHIYDYHIHVRSCLLCLVSLNEFTCNFLVWMWVPWWFNYPGPLLNTRIGYPVHQGRDALCLA